MSSACVRAPCFFLGLAGLSATRRTQSALTWPSMEGMFHPMEVATSNAACPTWAPASRRGRPHGPFLRLPRRPSSPALGGRVLNLADLAHPGRGKLP